ncbi:Uncharacterised protein [Vibrio cholerae]|nr:Uncharacterised protein [Vibrio cholerae]
MLSITINLIVMSAMNTRSASHSQRNPDCLRARDEFDMMVSLSYANLRTSPSPSTLDTQRPQMVV